MALVWLNSRIWSVCSKSWHWSIECFSSCRSRSSWNRSSLDQGQHFFNTTRCHPIRTLINLGSSLQRQEPPQNGYEENNLGAFFGLLEKTTHCYLIGDFADQLFGNLNFWAFSQKHELTLLLLQFHSCLRHLIQCLDECRWWDFFICWLQWCLVLWWSVLWALWLSFWAKRVHFLHFLFCFEQFWGIRETSHGFREWWLVWLVPNFY